MSPPGLYTVEEKLLDGRSLLVRAVRPTDKPILVEGMKHLSAESSYYRFLTPKRELTTKELQFFTELDFHNHVALLAIVKVDGKEYPAGIGRYVLMDAAKEPDCAELAFVVEDEFQHRGIATLLLKHLGIIARASGIKRFKAIVLADNLKMLDVFKHSGLPFASKIHTAGVLELTLSLEPETEFPLISGWSNKR